MTIAAPATCHHTDTLLMMASRWLEKMLTRVDDDHDDDEHEELRSRKSPPRKPVV